MVAPYILKMEYIDWFDMCQLFFKNFTGGIMSWNWFGTINYNNKVFWVFFINGFPLGIMV
jgi:hypothetical protein